MGNLTHETETRKTSTRPAAEVAPELPGGTRWPTKLCDMFKLYAKNPNPGSAIWLEEKSYPWKLQRIRLSPIPLVNTVSSSNSARQREVLLNLAECTAVLWLDPRTPTSPTMVTSRAFKPSNHMHNSLDHPAVASLADAVKGGVIAIEISLAVKGSTFNEANTVPLRVLLEGPIPTSTSSPSNNTNPNFRFGHAVPSATVASPQRQTHSTFIQRRRPLPLSTSRWAKQNFKEQLVLLELLFWVMWGYAPCDGPLVEKIFRTAYDVNLGSTQANATLLLDEESTQLQQDCAALWILICVEVLELETVGSETVELSNNPSHKNFYLSSLEAQEPSRDQDSPHVEMCKACLGPEVGLLNLLHSLLTQSPLFVTAVAWKAASTVTDPNAIAFRSVLKGLIMALVELVPVELIPDFEGAVFDVARSRFPVQVQPLPPGSWIQTLSPFQPPQENHKVLTEERDLCDQHVFYYFQHLTTYSQVIPISACTGPHALYERQTERYGSNHASGLTYVNTRPIKFPGGSTLPPRSQGRLLSGDGGDLMITSTAEDCTGTLGVQDISFERRSPTTVKALRLEDIGVQIDPSGDDATITDILDLLRSLIQDNPAQAQQLMLALEEGDSVVSHTMMEAQVPDLVQLITMVLEEALIRSGGQARYLPITQLVTSAMSVLSALLRLPAYSPRVWLYVRSTNALLGSDRGIGFASVALATERATGRYTMTLALLHLVQQLFQEASCSVLSDNPRLRQLKEEILFRIHTEIWVEHHGWKYAQLGDRFEIGRRAASFYVDILRNASPLLSDRPFVNLSQVVVDAFLFKATISSRVIGEFQWAYSPISLRITTLR
ncbi:hypothetical protein BDN72DRAFT_917479 [Pluteus cervinus]|uniref:Uncharacterized protein n=1 Tax=Pluteus cervinus TaxID=181527 RepID=A0ACD3ALN6_9AGAR|nr:hypothetical protein BDN72DRAFT_917479 [Pluteus cervinus]